MKVIVTRNQSFEQFVCFGFKEILCLNAIPKLANTDEVNYYLLFRTIITSNKNVPKRID